MKVLQVVQIFNKRSIFVTIIVFIILSTINNKKDKNKIVKICYTSKLRTLYKTKDFTGP